MSTSRRFLSGSALGMLDQAIKIASALVLTPMLVAGLGTESYGVWCVVMAIFAQYGWLDLGLGLALPRFFGKAVGSHDGTRIRSLAGTGAGILTTTISAAILATAALMWFVPGWIPGNISDARWLLLICGSLTVIQMGTLLFTAYLKSHLRYDLIAVASICRIMLVSALIWLGLKQHLGLAGLAGAHALCILMETILLVSFARRQIPSLRPRLSDFQWATAKEVLKYSSVSFAMTAGQTIRSSLDPIIVAARVNAAAVTGYSLGNRFPMLFVDLAHILVGGQLLSYFSLHAGPADEEKVRESHWFATRGCASLAVLGGGLMWLMGHPFLLRWVPADAEAAWAVMGPTIIPKALFVAQTPNIVFLLAIGRHHKLAGLDWLGGLLNVALSWWLAASLGAPGVAWATCIEQSLVCVLLLPLLVSQVTGISFGNIWWSRFMWPLLRAGLVLLPCFLLAPMLQPDYTVITIATMACSVWFFAVIWLFLSQREKEFIKAVISSLHARKPL